MKKAFLSLVSRRETAIQSALGLLVAAGFVILQTSAIGNASGPLTNSPAKAVAVLHPTGGNTAQGTVELEQTADGVTLKISVEGLSPGKHGFHIHEYGNCSSLDGTSAGGHFNPDGAKHGGPADKERHVGDLGNIVAGPEGKAVVEFLDGRITLHGPDSVIGRAIVVHGGTDDLSSQPAGAAGPRVACGVIGLAAE